MSDDLPKFKLEIIDAKTKKRIIVLQGVHDFWTVGIVKREIYQLLNLDPYRQSIRTKPDGICLSNVYVMRELNLPSDNPQLYMYDLGPQIGWETAFFLGYLGPLMIYSYCFFRPKRVYDQDENEQPMLPIAKLAFVCWVVHFVKRLYETLFVHRFSQDTMPIRSGFAICVYYYGFAALIAYYMNHPLYVAPTYGWTQATMGMIMFLVSEYGNYEIHAALRDMRPIGTKDRPIPTPNENLMTRMFNLVSCPNYTYEFLAWLSYSVMTESVPALIFTVAGLITMSIWAGRKHDAYHKKVEDYPIRAAIIPYIW